MCMKGCGGEMEFYVGGEMTDFWLVLTIGHWDSSDRRGQIDCLKVCDTEREAIELTAVHPIAWVVQSKQYRRFEIEPSHNLGMSVDDLM